MQTQNQLITNNNMIHKKLLDFQKKNITVEKDGTNPHFRSSYATLNEVLDKVKKPLNEIGILILQTPEATGLRTKLIDTEDDSSVECFMPYVEVTTAQKLGSNNTYNRRYSLVTMLGLEDVDDDGEVASTTQAPKKETQKNTILEKQKLVSLFKEYGIDPLIVSDKQKISEEVKRLTSLDLVENNYKEIISRFEVLIGEKGVAE